MKESRVENGTVLNTDQAAEKGQGLDTANVFSKGVEKVEEQETVRKNIKVNLMTEVIGPMAKGLFNLKEKKAMHLSTEGCNKIGEEWKGEKKSKGKWKQPRSTQCVINQLETNYYYCLALKDIKVQQEVKREAANNRLTQPRVNNQKAKKKVWQKRASVKRSKGFRRRRKNNKKARRNFFKKCTMVEETTDKSKEGKENMHQVSENSHIEKFKT